MDNELDSKEESGVSSMDARAARHVRGIDSIRFIAALWVACAHGLSLPLKQLLSSTGTLGQAIATANSVAFNGTLAVTVFFVISGLCIHLPYVDAGKVPLAEFYTRRYVRVGVPLLVMLALGRLWPEPVGAGKDVLWSVYCELAYYTLYPFLFPLIRKGALRHLILITTIASAALIATHWSYLRQWEFGPLTFLVGYPSWLLGCLLANFVVSRQEVRNSGNIWAWRIGAWLYSVAALLTVFHTPVKVGYPVTSLAFSFYCFYWLRFELVRWRASSPVKWLEAGGRWSFSLYLVHKVVIEFFDNLQTHFPILVLWAFKVVAAFAVSYLFFIVVERPCHQAARRWARMMRAEPLSATTT